MKHQPKPTTFNQAGAILGNRRGIKIAHNTRLLRISETEIGVKLHDTFVVRFTKDGRTILNTGGWESVTTKERINRYLPDDVHLYQEKFKWYLQSPGTTRARYFDGISIWHNHQPLTTNL
jgi:hypothetical protein